MGSSAATQWALRPNIAKEMQHELLSCKDIRNKHLKEGRKCERVGEKIQ